MKKTIVFILGTGRNGSTLLDMALNSHNKIFSVGEMDHLEGDIQKEKSSVCGCYKPLKNCKFWNIIWRTIRYNYNINNNPFYQKNKTSTYKMIRKAVNTIDFIFSVLNIFPKRPHSYFSKMYKEEIYEYIFLESNKSLISDSMKNYERALRISNYLKGKYNFKFIHLVRDGRAVVHSYTKSEYKYYLKDIYGNKVKIEEKRKVGTKTKIKNYINNWKYINKNIYFFIKYFRRDGYLLVKYENLCNSPENELKRICKFLGISYQKEMLKLDMFENHIIRGNPSAKFKAKVIKTPNMNFLHNLSKEEVDIFNKVAGKLNNKLGYTLQVEFDLIDY